MKPIRTMSLIPGRIKITIKEHIPLYQKLAPKIKELKALGITNNKIAKKFRISIKTVKKSSKNR